jgi:F-type H+-transporting ATPase subunit delta
MPHARLAGRYAKSLIGLAVEKNQLENVYKDMLFLEMVVNGSRDFVTLLKSPIIKSDKKQAILDAVTSNGNLSELTLGFSRLLVNKSRESNLPEIITAFIEQYKVIKGIFTIKLTTAVPVSEELKQAIVHKVQSETSMKNIDLRIEVDEKIIGGYVLEMGDKLVDASIAFDLSKISSQFKKNEFIFNIR